MYIYIYIYSKMLHCLLKGRVRNKKSSRKVK